MISHAAIIIRIPITPVSGTTAPPGLTAPVIGAAIAVIAGIGVERNAEIDARPAIVAAIMPSAPVVAAFMPSAPSVGFAATTAHEQKVR